MPAYGAQPLAESVVLSRDSDHRHAALVLALREQAENASQTPLVELVRTMSASIRRHKGHATGADASHPAVVPTASSPWCCATESDEARARQAARSREAMPTDDVLSSLHVRSRWRQCARRGGPSGRARGSGRSHGRVRGWQASHDVYEQLFLLHVLLHRHGADYDTRLLPSNDATVRAVLDCIYQQAAAIQQWSIVRLAAAISRKVVDSLAPSITEMLVRGKEVTLGVFGGEETVIAEPRTPADIQVLAAARHGVACARRRATDRSGAQRIIFDTCNRDGASREASLQQEMVILLARLMTSEPQSFDGMLRVRVGYVRRRWPAGADAQADAQADA